MENIKISLKAARINANKTLNDTANYIGLSTRTIQSYEKGKTIPDYEVAEKLSEFYNIPLDYIFLKRNIAKALIRRRVKWKETKLWEKMK